MEVHSEQHILKVDVAKADNEEIPETILYHLNMDFALEKTKKIDCLQFLLNYEKQQQGHLTSILSMTDM
jgi:hypothetical protein